MFRRQMEVIGKENQKILNEKSVVIAGCGGLGNIIAATVGCMGLKRIYLFDDDNIEIHNLHRQFLFDTKDIGKNKAEVLAKKTDRCENTQIIAFSEKFSSGIDLQADLIFDATDNFDARFQIDRFAKKHNIPWIYASVEEMHGQTGVFKTTSFEIFATKKHEVKGQLPPMVNIIGSIASMLGLKTLINQQDEILYYVDFKNGLEIKKFGF
jgi:adenylyltransferase/sulfurtransferase